ncbi:Molybdopterin-synthase adenylyltransferase [Saliniradius amylolyticus]|uniref:Molybdopterin-synthase adenylyltransferase n=1 Tax=Saliniradius amylolyticus TaxID=2183582 RepID=A0A2S2E338_9ALTE|nr:ThiF family adenylyltransferase [Saliniradius amylolyticus]AWL11670.1 Molybdopterin-synthase adenylyltransferase [Saliniradius amylolyticus]
MFDYQAAFSRNIGWVTDAEQDVLRGKRIAIAGMGGVGSEHLVTLVRLGVENFNISDFDEFEIHNINRQAGALLSRLGGKKCQVMADIARDTNPQLALNEFPEGISEGNVDAFLNNVDLYVDSLDFFALEARKLIFRRCEELKIPVITAAPLGMGVAFLCFMPGKMTYEDYFRFDDVKSEEEQLIQFLIGLSPAMMQRHYLVDASKADFKARKGPSLVMGVKLCAGVAATYALKILLERGPVIHAPYGLHFDAYRNRTKITWRPWGNRNPLQRIAFHVAKRVVLSD